MLIKIEGNTLRLQKTQTRGTVNPEPLSDVVSSIIGICKRQAAKRCFAAALNAEAKKKTPSDRGPVDRNHPARDSCSVAPRKRGLSSLATPSRPMLLQTFTPKSRHRPHRRTRPAEHKNKPPKRDTGAAFAFKRDGGTTRSARWHQRATKRHIFLKMF